MERNQSIQNRKAEHIRISLEEDVSGRNTTTGFEAYQFIHQALPEMDFNEMDMSTTFLGRTLKAPFLISSMTGGTEEAFKINKNLAHAAEERGWAMGLGSTRAALESDSIAHTFQIRKYAPSIPIIANLGAVQLNYGYGLEECRRIIDLTEADALVLHLNTLQEVFQTGGNTNFKGLALKIEAICSGLDVPVGIKEVGWGIHGELTQQLEGMGASFIDVAGSGGTSWSQVEKLRASDPLLKSAAEAFADWGIPTAECIQEARQNGYKGTLISSGGMTSGVDTAKAIALGADLAGFGRSLLQDAVSSAGNLIQTFSRMELELRIAMFGIGARTLTDLRNTPHLRKRQ
ncbi:type 2 isopentenyl-diphosphate Delta-isomerase [Peribacillus kribbensis]|uniref:type 2 isopentenyl-diphosphate Delta-isomerase n=1 Tax=Peribacillus kribbensis TaxID=356658 RepID=UPI000404AE2B|nr:type 2 isopentenyl-diphosphate Delta-isomerase [Peribacillus kribbensis]